MPYARPGQRRHGGAGARAQGQVTMAKSTTSKGAAQAPTKGAQAPTKGAQAPAVATLAAPTTPLPPLPANATTLGKAGTNVAKGAQVAVAGSAYVLPASHTALQARMARTVWPSMDAQATVQVAHAGAPGMAVHCRTGSSTGALATMVPLASRLAVPAGVHAAAQALAQGAAPTAAQAQAVATWLAQAAPVLVALPAGGTGA